MFLLALLASAVASPLASHVRADYTGNKVVRLSGLSAPDVPVLLDTLGLDFWAEPKANTWDVRASPAQLLALHQRGYSFEVLIEDLQALIDEEHARIAAAPKPTTTVEWFEEYHPLDEIIEYYQAKAAQYPNLVTFIPSIGTTFQGRNVTALRVGAAGTGQRRIFLQGGIHAREWVSPPTVAWIFTQLVEGYGTDADATYLLNNFEFLFVPVVNPDGYSFSWTNDRMWRKNRRTNTGSSCIGVDLNRNWGVQWQPSANPCSDSYPGTSAFSEAESRSISQWYQSLGNVQAAIDFHAYSQLILRPYGYTTQNCPDERSIAPMGDGMAEALREVHGSRYQSQKSAELYPANGETTDWFYEGNDRYTWGFTVELRDTGRYGFELPAEQIIPTGEENYAAIVFMGYYLMDNHPGNN